jgi:hypothetical protein
MFPNLTNMLAVLMGESRGLEFPPADSERPADLGNQILNPNLILEVARVNPFLAAMAERIRRTKTTNAS